MQLQVVIALVLALAAPPARTYHQVTVRELATTRWTHVEVTGLVTYVRKMKDGDYHVTLEDGGVTAVSEIIPAIPLPPPRKNQRCTVRGISRVDRHHGWGEVHPVEWIACRPASGGSARDD